MLLLVIISHVHLALIYQANVILSDDGSTDSTAKIAESLGITVFKNPRSAGYGSNVKNCFNKAIELGGDIVIILHSDNQYDATKISAMADCIQFGQADLVIGSRILGDQAKGMSTFRFTGNRFLGAIENIAMGTNITDLHSGLIAVRTKLLKIIPFNTNSDDYGFHTNILLQSRYAGAKFSEIGIPTRYEDVSTSISVYKSIIYGFSTLATVFKYLLHKNGIIHYAQFNFNAKLD